MLEALNQISMIVSATTPQYRFLEMQNAGLVAPANSAGDDCVAISLEGRTAGDVTLGKTCIPVALPGGKCFIEAGAAINISAAVVPVTTDSVGRAVAVAAATDRILGYALQSAGAAGEIIEILFLKGADRRDA